MKPHNLMGSNFSIHIFCLYDVPYYASWKLTVKRRPCDKQE